MSKICAIHQPNFFPWLGYFDKIERADVFIFLDHVQNSKTGSSWFNRTKINYYGTPKWLTCPIKRKSGTQVILDVEYSNEEWHKSFLLNIENYYHKYSNCSRVLSQLKYLIHENISLSLCEFNKQVVRYFMKYLNIETTLASSSEIDVKGKSNELLTNICKAVGADTYLCGGGSQGYLDDDIFAKKGIEIKFQDYNPIPYTENNYIPGLSIIDYLMSTT